MTSSWRRVFVGQKRTKEDKAEEHWGYVRAWSWVRSLSWSQWQTELSAYILQHFLHGFCYFLKCYCSILGMSHSFLVTVKYLYNFYNDLYIYTVPSASTHYAIVVCNNGYIFFSIGIYYNFLLEYNSCTWINSLFIHDKMRWSKYTLINENIKLLFIIRNWLRVNSPTRKQ